MGAARNLGDATNMAFTAPVLTPRVVNARFTYFVGGQVAIPPHASAYNGFSRGFNFTSNSDFNITQLSLPLDANVAGDTASYLVMINGAVAYRSIGNPGAVNLGLHVSVGDIVDVIGNWSPAAAGAFSAHNSYAFATPYQTFIAGIANTLNRTGWQWDIGDPNWTPNGSTGNYVQPATGSMGRIIMTGVVGTTVATATKLGDGCISRHGSVYEEFQTSASFDLTGHAITLFPVVGGGYTVSSLGTFRPVGSTSVPVVLGLGDDTEVTVPFTLGSFPGWTGVTVCSNGFVSKAVGNGTSFSGPVMAGIMACLWQKHPTRTAQDLLYSVRLSSSQGLMPDTLYGHGIPNLALASTLLGRMEWEQPQFALWSDSEFWIGQLPTNASGTAYISAVGADGRLLGYWEEQVENGAWRVPRNPNERGAGVQYWRVYFGGASWTARSVQTN